MKFIYVFLFFLFPRFIYCFSFFCISAFFFSFLFLKKYFFFLFLCFIIVFKNYLHRFFLNSYSYSPIMCKFVILFPRYSLCLSLFLSPVQHVNNFFLVCFHILLIILISFSICVNIFLPSFHLECFPTIFFTVCSLTVHDFLYSFFSRCFLSNPSGLYFYKFFLTFHFHPLSF